MTASSADGPMRPVDLPAYDPVRAARNRRHARWRRLRSPLLGAAMWGGGRLFGSLPWTQAQALGRRIGRLASRIGGRDNRRMRQHLSIAFPELDGPGQDALALACWEHLGTSLGELLHLRYRDPAEANDHVEVHGFEVVEALRQEKRPILILTGHCGNWEMISAANRSHGLDLVAMGRASDERHVAETVTALRQHLGTTTIARGSSGSSRQMLKTIRRGGALALLIDQDIVTEGVWVPFFGRLAFTPTAAADIALRLGGAAVPTFAERLEDGSHRVTFYPPLELEDCCRGATATMTAAIEAQIRRRPEQWVWMHRRWRHRPPEECAP